MKDEAKTKPGVPPAVAYLFDSRSSQLIRLFALYPVYLADSQSARFSLDPWFHSCLDHLVSRAQPCADVLPGTEPHRNGQPAASRNQSNVPCRVSAGSRVVDWKIGNGAPRKEHGNYMLSLYIKGSMRLAGPLTDNAGELSCWKFLTRQRRRRSWQTTRQ